jgi:ribosome maturation factor RimP
LCWPTEMAETMDELETRIETRIAELDPAIELIALERPGRDVLRLYIDHPDGVGLELCERVTLQLRELLADYGLEVSSPGADRPLTKPAHYGRFLGRRVRVRTSEPVEGSRNFTGELISAGDDEIRIRVDEREVALPHGLISRSNLVPQPLEVQS